MPHQSDADYRLLIQECVSWKEYVADLDGPWCSFVDLYTQGSALAIQDLSNDLQALDSAHPDSLLCVLLLPETAAYLTASLPDGVYCKLWIAVAAETKFSGLEKLQSNHIALLVLSGSGASLRHAKTRIEYTICPSCGKTTKDYGGKKHTYNSYGTLMSDVWRDIVVRAGEHPSAVVDRLQDLFASNGREVLVVQNDNNDLNCHSGDSFAMPVDLSRPAWKSTKGNKIGAADLRVGDCLEIMEGIDDNSVDFAFADPPYNIDKKYDRWNDSLDIQDYFSWCDKWIAEMFRIVKPGGAVAVINIPQWSARHADFMSSVGFFHDWIVWEGLSLPVRQIMPAHYGIVVYTKGETRLLPGYSNYQNEYADLSSQIEWYCSRASCLKRRVKNGECDRQVSTNLWHDIHRLKHNSRRVDHPCQLPPLLMRRLISWYTYPGETVLDPFNGAGTTTLTSVQMGRNAIGIEMSSEYHKLAVSRHKEIDLGLDPFRKAERKLEAKNSRVERMPKRKYIVPKKTLQLDVRSIALDIGRMPSRDDVQRYSKYPIKYFDEYFISWGEVCAAVRNDGMTEDRR